jgi:hypothetical protein
MSVPAPTSPRCIQSMSSHPTFLRYISISSYLYPGLPKNLSFKCPINKLYPHIFSLPFVPHAQLISFTLISWLWYLVRNTQIVCVHYTVFSIFLSLPLSQAQISFSAHYSWNIFNLCSPFNVRDQVSILYKTRQNCSVIHFTPCILSIKQKTKKILGQTAVCIPSIMCS